MRSVLFAHIRGIMAARAAGAVSVAAPVLSAIVGGSTITLTVVDNTGGVGETIIQRSTNGVLFTTLTTLAAGVTSYINSGLADGVYFYRAISQVGTDQSEPSPVVSRTVATSGIAAIVDGESFTISGMNFGTKSTALPIVFDHFGGGTVGQNVKPNAPAYRADPSWVWEDQGINSNRPQYSDDAAGLRQGRTRCAKMVYSGGTYASALEVLDNRSNTGAESFRSYWIKYVKTNALNTRNFKPVISYGTSQLVPEFYLGFGDPNEGDGYLRDSFQDLAIGASQASSLNATHRAYGVNIGDLIDHYVRFDVWIRQSDAGVSNGAVQVLVHRPDSGVPVETAIEANNIVTRLYSDRNWMTHLIGAYHANDGGASALVYISDAYVDSTRQRIEIGDAPTWSACTYREIQPATNWVNESVTAVANLAGFEIGQTVYIYAVGPDGIPLSTTGIPRIVAASQPPASGQPDYVALPVNQYWLGDSEINGNPTGRGLCQNIVTATRALWSSYYTVPWNSSIPTMGVGGRSLASSLVALQSLWGTSSTQRPGPDWVHIVESGEQNLDGQRTPAEYAATADTALRWVRNKSPNALITMETAHSFGREATAYRDWHAHNEALRAKIAELNAEGLNIRLVDVEHRVEALEAIVGSALCWNQPGTTGEYHFTVLGNLMVALAIYWHTGHDISAIDFSSILAEGRITQSQIDACLTVINGAYP